MECGMSVKEEKMIYEEEIGVGWEIIKENDKGEGNGGRENGEGIKSKIEVEVDKKLRE